VRLPQWLRASDGAETTTVTVASNGTVASLKATLEGAFGVRRVRQTLQCDGKELTDDAATLWSITGIRNEWDVHLSLKPPTLESEGVPDLGVLKLEIAGDLEPPAFVVHVELPPSLRAAHVSSLPIATTAQATVGDLKATLETALGVRVARLTLRDQNAMDAARAAEATEHVPARLYALRKAAEEAAKRCCDDATLASLGIGHQQSTLRLSLPGDTEADAELFEWVETQEVVGDKKFLRLAAAHAQCAHCNERSGPLVSDGVKGSEKQGAYGDQAGRKLSTPNPDETFFRFACRRCGGAYGPVLRAATYKHGKLKNGNKKAPSNCKESYKIADRIHSLWTNEHRKKCTAPSNNEAAASSAPAAAAASAEARLAVAKADSSTCGSADGGSDECAQSPEAASVAGGPGPEGATSACLGSRKKKKTLTPMDKCREEVFANCVRVSGRASVLLSVTRSELINRWSDEIPNCEKTIDSFEEEHGREGHEGLTDPSACASSGRRWTG